MLVCSLDTTFIEGILSINWHYYTVKGDGTLVLSFSTVAAIPLNPPFSHSYLTESLIFVLLERYSCQKPVYERGTFISRIIYQSPFLQGCYKTL